MKGFLSLVIIVGLIAAAWICFEGAAHSPLLGAQATPFVPATPAASADKEPAASATPSTTPAASPTPQATTTETATPTAKPSLTATATHPATATAEATPSPAATLPYTPIPLPTLPVTASTTVTATIQPPPAATAAATAAVVNGTGDSTVEQAHARLVGEGWNTVLIIVSLTSTGVEGEIYHDLRSRSIRATTGPDEGIDTRSLDCNPNCLFVPLEEINALPVGTWEAVLRHEYRHIVQAINNPNLAADFRDPGGEFTTYAALLEACADYGLNVAPMYHASERMGYLMSAMGQTDQPLIDQACSGDKAAYDKLVQEYNGRAGSAQAFAQLFPPYD